MEILYNDKVQRYTLHEELNGEKSYKRIPIKFKFEDSTARFRTEELKKELLKE